MTPKDIYLLGSQLRLGIVAPETAAGEIVAAAQASDPTSMFDVNLLEHPIRREELEQLIQRILADQGHHPIDDCGAGWAVARNIASAIVERRISPIQGANRIWWDVARTVPELEDDLIVFNGLASEWEDSPNMRQQIESDIVRAARALLTEAE